MSSFSPPAWARLAAAMLLMAQAAALALTLRAGTAGAWVLALQLSNLALTGLLIARVSRALKRAATEVGRARSTLDEAIAALPASVEIFDADDRLVAFNQQLVQLYPHMQADLQMGVRFEDLVRKSISQGCVPSAQGREEEWLMERLVARRTRSHAASEPLLQHLQMQSDRWVRVYERRLQSGGIIGVRMDVSDLVLEQQRLAASKAHLTAFVRATPNGVLTLDTSGHVLELNPAAEALFGFSAHELQGSHIDLLFGTWMGERLSPAALLGRPQELTVRRRDGQALTLQLSVAEVKTETTHRFVCIITDLSERKRQELELQEANALLARQSITDGLTGVGNRRFFDQLLQQEWQRSARHGHALACIMVDIDHFKLFNDRYGHVAGDDCLRRVAELLRTCAGRSSDAVCRYGGEEFVILLAECDLAEAQVVAQRCLDSIRLAAIPHDAAPMRRRVSLSIGVAACVAGDGEASWQDGARPSSAGMLLVERADAALYAAKQGGRSRMVCCEREAA
ncbi:diguanylate cyclase [Paucibacter sp. AS339]|uniref:sensor domain-containing diguanylate cyclase n=1 Tax=Paucibacter hankyongi TaxID=3133434 RepID=UPI0030B35BE7